jgi:hypothetical protein
MSNRLLKKYTTDTDISEVTTIERKQIHRSVRYNPSANPT